MKYLVSLLFLLYFSSCDSDTVDTSFLPNVPVNVQINLNLPEYQNLLIGGGFSYANGGIRGLIIYNSGLGYVAFDRACPHITLQTCSTMDVESIFMVCPCDNERFQINDGAPENGNILQAARYYNVTKSGNILTISS